MSSRKLATALATVAGSVAAAISGSASAQVIISDDFTQASDSNNWKTFNGACLTAGDGTGTIPKCYGLGYYAGQTLYGGYSGTLPDTAGNGALRFTNGNNSGSGFANGYNQAGSIISNFTFPTGAGLQVVFKTMTYRGNSGGNGGGGTVDGKDGADGMSFFLMDGANFTPYDTGAFGGSLGYSCSNSNNDGTKRGDGTTRGYDGLAGAYLGLGIDEYGNFLNPSDNTASGPGLQAGRIGLRGAGNITWAQLYLKYLSYFPTLPTLAQQQSVVKNTCHNGYLSDWNNNAYKDTSNNKLTVMDYPAIPSAYKVLSGVKIANESALNRNQSNPDATRAIPITYNLKITQNGLLSLSYSYDGAAYIPVISGQSITASNGALPSSFRFGFAGSTGGSTNIHEILCFQAQPADLASTSVGVNEKEATKIQTGTQAYLAFYYPSNWTGRLTASNLLYDSTQKNIVVSSTANWDAQCNLTGVATGQTCPTTLGGPSAAQVPSTRIMYTYDGTNGLPFLFSSFNTTMQGVIDAGDATPINNYRVKYLRGERTNEIDSTGTGLFRARDGLLGDIVDSSPTWVGPPAQDSSYPAVWVDLLDGGTPLENSAPLNYSQFAAAANGRLNVVYAGANDGFVHGFRTGSFDSSNNYINNTTTPNDGQEVLAYMPNAIFQTIHNATDGTLDYSNSQYAHNWFVDATPVGEELFYGNAWHTWLVGGLGPGGAALYALDVTDPTQFTSSNAKNIVLGEWNASNISCSGNATCGTNLGNTYGVPVIRRLHNGSWAVIFGNGYGSSTGDAGIYIMTVDPSSGSRTFYYLSTGTTGTGNGISYVAPSDIDGDHITDYVYAGDLKGNVWRFDLTSTSAASWAVRSSPLFTVPSGSAITTKLMVSAVKQTTGNPRVMVMFGTGRKTPQTTTISAQYATGSQSMYGIWDWDMAAYNTASLAAYQVASLTAPQTVTLSKLTVQTLTQATSTVRDITSVPVCYAGSTICGSGNTQFGWTVALPATNEQLIFNPIVDQLNNAFLFNTTIPFVSSPGTCNAQTDTGYTLALQQDTGGAVTGYFPNYNDSNAAGSQSNGTGTPFLVSAAGSNFLLTQSLGNGGQTGVPIICPKGALYCSSMIKTTGATGKRLTWIQRR
jgi:type IV pilus assembly protein PilY1